jgi:hypothetical protein
MRIGERKAEVRRCAGIRGGRIEHVRILTLADYVPGDGIGTADSRNAAWVEYPIVHLRNRG